MKFNKEYIELAKNEKIQGLRPELDYGDWYLDLDGIEAVCHDYEIVGSKLSPWLPTGDQLDEEIVKICGDTFCYHIKTSVYPEVKWHCSIHDKSDIGEEYFNSSNPLIAKIKLLIKLLEEK